MSTSLRVKRLALSAAMLAAAMLLSYVEAVLPVELLIPLPGFKLGLANIAVMLLIYNVGIAEGAAVSLARIMLSAALFGSVSSLWFSLGGGILALAAMAAAKLLLKDKVSYIGISVLSAVAHNIGQLIAAAAIFGAGVFSYLPWLLLMAVITGVFTGAVCIPVSSAFKRNKGIL